MAGQEGLEPPTRGFGVRCSTIGATDLHLIHETPKPGARDRTRTGDLSLTKEVLCQLSYVGVKISLKLPQ